jgi:hypothetical protein
LGSVPVLTEHLQAVSSELPLILASLKSLMETGNLPEPTRRWPDGI